MSVSIAVSDLRKTYSTGAGSSKSKPLLAARRSRAAVPVNALDGISFSVAEGERVGIVGENGAGKSTLLRILAGLAQPTSGAVDVKGRVHAALTLGVGLREEMTGRENLYIDAAIQGVASSRLAAHVEAMVAFADLGEFIDRPVRTYSSGMKSRLSFTSLVFIEPEILLIDEALSAGDQWFQRKANAAVRELCARGKIIIVVSHGLSAIVEMCSRCLWLHHGKIAADGDPADVTALYSDHERRREEERLAGEFAGRVDNWSKTLDASIAGLVLGEHAGAPAKYLFRPDAAPTVTIDLALSKPLRRPSLRLWIERIDGLMVTENQPPALLMERGMVPGLCRVNANMERLLLGPGLFLLFVELRDGEAPIARRSLAFKVDIDRPLIGGRPVLHAPISVSAARASA